MNSGYHLAIMRYEIVLSPEAVNDLKRLDANERTKVHGALEVHLRHDPLKVSKSRIKRLRGLSQPQYRLRINDLRAFYDVEGNQVQVLAIVAKSDAQAWLEQSGKSDENGPTVGSEG